MCIIIDANTFSKVFNVHDANHDEFSPVLDWVENGRGKLVYGGTKYLHEIGDRKRKILLEFRKQGKAIPIDSDAVDYEEAEVNKIYSHRNFDDPHLVALIRASRCRLLCSGDKKANPFIKNQVRGVDLYEGKAKPPKIYSNKKYGVQLLCDANIVHLCNSCP